MISTIFLVFISGISFVKLAFIPSLQIDQGSSPIIELNQGATDSIDIDLTFTTPFSNIPKVLLGYNQLEYTPNTQLDWSFKLELISTTLADFKVRFTKYGQTTTQVNSLTYLAIDSEDVYVVPGEIDFATDLQPSAPTERVASKTYSYSRQITDPNVQRVVSVYLTGVKQVNDQAAADPKLSIVVSIQENPNDFMVIATQYDVTQFTQTVQFNYIEHYVNVATDYYKTIKFVDNSLIQNIGLFDGVNSDSIVPISNMDCQVNSLLTVFTAFTGIQSIINSIDIKVKISNRAFPGNLYSFDYVAYIYSVVDFVTSNTLSFAQLQCQSIPPYIVYNDYIEKCEDICSVGYYQTYNAVLMREECQPCISLCDHCTSSGNTCTKCSKGYYLLNGSCLSKCLSTHPFAYNYTCYSIKPKNTYCESDNNCYPCSLRCQECFGANHKKCYSCKNGYNLDGTSCICSDSYQLYNEVTKVCENIPLEILEKKEYTDLESATKDISVSILASLLALTFTQGIIKKGSSYLLQVLTVQKIFYMTLLNVYLIQPLVDFLKAASSINALNSMQKTGKSFIKLVNINYDDFESENIGGKFSQIDFTSNMFINTTGVFVILFIFVLISLLFLTLKKTSIQGIASKVFEKGLASAITQNAQIASLIFLFSTILSFISFSEGESDYLPLKCFYIAIAICVCVALHILQVKILDSSDFNDSKVQPKEEQEQQSEQEEQVIEPKQWMAKAFNEHLINNTKRENKKERYFIIIYLLIELILFPIVVLSFYQTKYVQIIFVALIQIVEFLVITFVRPYKEKIDNIQGFFDSLIWSIIFILFFILSIIQSDIEPDNSSQVIISYSAEVIILLLIIFILIAILLNPFMIIIKAILDIKNLISKKRQSAKVQPLTNSDSQIFIEENKIRSDINKQNSDQKLMVDENQVDKEISQQHSEEKLEIDEENQMNDEGNQDNNQNKINSQKRKRTLAKKLPPIDKNEDAALKNKQTETEIISPKSAD